MTSIQSSKTQCDKHGKQLNLYCPSHLKPCCDKCISTSHSKCTGIKSFASVVEKTNIEKSKESVEKDINSFVHLLDKIVDYKLRNIKTGEQQCEDIKISIGKIRNEINKHLKILEKKLCQETNNIWDQEKVKATELISEIEQKKEQLKKNQDSLHIVTTSTSKLQSFLHVHQIEQQVHHCQRYVEDLENDERAKQVDIKTKQNNKIKKILSKLVSLESLGDVTIVKTDIEINRETSVRRKAQVESQEPPNEIMNLTMNIEKKIKSNIKKYKSDMICMMDGRLIVVEQWGTIYLLTSDGKLQKHLPINGSAFSVTQISEDTFGISYPKERAIKIFNMENETVTKVIPLIDKKCWGLSFYNNSLAVGLSSDEIRIIDLEGNTLKSIQVECESELSNLVYCNNHVLYSDYCGNAVYCYDESGAQIWRYIQDLSGPCGFCTDTDGNFIVANSVSNRIIVISKDGQSSKVLIRKKDGLYLPRCICFKHNESSGFICELIGTYLTKFNLSY